jgi:nicotinate-nucleotide pyrophosphorylase (carboxylating)
MIQPYIKHKNDNHVNQGAITLLSARNTSIFNNLNTLIAQHHRPSATKQHRKKAGATALVAQNRSALGFKYYICTSKIKAQLQTPGTGGYNQRLNVLLGATYMTQYPLPTDLAAQVKNTLAEDIGSGDISAALIAENAYSTAQVISRDTAILCGTAWFDEVFRQLDDNVTISWQAKDGDAIAANQTLCTCSGNARTLLTGERSALNLLQTLSATATHCHEFVSAVRSVNDSTHILDTRKTLPGLRNAQKYAVRCGGGQNHRIGLFDAFLIKENHILAAGSIAAAVSSARQQQPCLKVEVEVENLDEVQQALAAGADQLLLDNMSCGLLRQAVKLSRDTGYADVKLEASGGVNLDTVAAIAATGVDFISVGAITKDICAVDLSMRFIEP